MKLQKYANFTFKSTRKKLVVFLFIISFSKGRDFSLRCSLSNLK